jgi:hypothetical protein
MRQHEEAPDTLFLELLQVHILSVAHSMGDGEMNTDPKLGSTCLYAFGDLGEMRIADVRCDEADAVGETLSKMPPGRARHIAQQLDRPANSLCCVRCNQRWMVQVVRNRADRHLRQPRHLTDSDLHSANPLYFAAQRRDRQKLSRRAD